MMIGALVLRSRGSGVLKGSWDIAFPEILVEVLPAISLSEITPDLDLDRAGLDSFAMIDVLVRLEEHYNITFADDNLTAETFSTPESLWQAVKGLREHAASGHHARSRMAPR
jgi:diaminopimelate decarboxylase